jgi:hypothetical protein
MLFLLCDFVHRLVLLDNLLCREQKQVYILYVYIKSWGMVILEPKLTFLLGFRFESPLKILDYDVCPPCDII